MTARLHVVPCRVGHADGSVCNMCPPAGVEQAGGQRQNALGGAVAQQRHCRRRLQLHYDAGGPRVRAPPPWGSSSVQSINCQKHANLCSTFQPGQYGNSTPHPAPRVQAALPSGGGAGKHAHSTVSNKSGVSPASRVSWGLRVSLRVQPCPPAVHGISVQLGTLAAGLWCDTRLAWKI